MAKGGPTKASSGPSSSPPHWRRRFAVKAVGANSLPIVGENRVGWSAEFTLGVLGGGATAEATVAFANDPAVGELAVGVASFR